MSLSEDKTCDVLQDLYSALVALEEKPETGEVFTVDFLGVLFLLDIAALSVITLLTSCACLAVCLLTNIYIAVNIIYTGKFKVNDGLVFYVCCCTSN